MFTIEMLPADYGDCLWIEYGNTSQPHRILIDCGTLSTSKVLRERLARLPAEQRHFELLVVTHIDTDHIDAAVKLLNAKTLPIQCDQIWFNDWNHLASPDRLGAAQGEYFAALIGARNIPLNASFGGAAVVVPDAGALPAHTLAGGMKLTLLSPTRAELEALISVWKEELKKKGRRPGDADAALRELAKDKKYAPDVLGPAGPNLAALAARPFHEDDSPANGSSIAFLAEYEGKACLFAADARPSVLGRGLDRFLEMSGLDRLPLAACKVPHHGSRRNTSADLLRKLRCPNFLISTSGAKFGHPDTEAIARIITLAQPSPTLCFNYRSRQNEIWNDTALKTKYRYHTVFPDAPQAGISIPL